ncbi:hypothetical protein PIIN_10441 [Serendipita indica DSM 11827]|uniref:Profilin n=1 Tax=Serendipita indica (strain DSM 11827) TaxID=1109443 RepID=G4TYQ5_SERID|nr:hypothetical protein PIIN_10441 [Serendipita indica DSM 11827]
MADPWKQQLEYYVINGGKAATKSATAVALMYQAQGEPWSKTDNLAFQPGEADAIRKLFTNPNRDEARANGVRIGGKKYFVTSFESGSRSLYGMQGPNGCVIVTTNSSIIVAICEPPIDQKLCIAAVEGFADYLMKLNY